MSGATAIAGMASLLSFSGVFTGSGSANPVVSSSRTINQSGTLYFDSVASDVGALQYSKNGAAYSNVTEGMTLAMTAADTLQLKAPLTTPGQTASCNIKNNVTRYRIEAVVLTRT